MIKPLRKNGTIGVVAPAFPPKKDKLEKGIQYLEKLGYKVQRGESLEAKHGYFAGDDALRLKDLHAMFSKPEIDAIICARGGWGTLRLLHQLDYQLINRNPKLLVGYSDITTLQLAIFQKTGIPSLSGPMAAVEMGDIPDFTAKHFWDQVYNEANIYRYYFDVEDNNTRIWQAGQSEGVLLGGCLSMVAHQIGTPYSPDYRGNILFLEDVGEEPYKVDRYLAQLKQSGMFNDIRGLILGNFLDCMDDNPDRQGFSIEDVLRDYFYDAPYPVIYNFPYGHGARKISMPIGVKCRVNNDEKWVQFNNPFKSG